MIGPVPCEPLHKRLQRKERMSAPIKFALGPSSAESLKEWRARTIMIQLDGKSPPRVFNSDGT
jgi:hypothetical protein